MVFDAVKNIKKNTLHELDSKSLESLVTVHFNGIEKISSDILQNYFFFFSTDILLKHLWFFSHRFHK